VSSGLCQCGCGGKTNIASQTQAKYGHVAGEPFRYIRGHHNRLSPVEWVEEDRGYATPCWIWQRALQENGYGVGNAPGGRACLAHRAAYQKAKGPIPDGYQIDHRCFQCACVNPDHLEAVPPATNVRRQRSTKLTVESVRQIRDLLREGWLQKDISRAFGVTHGSVSSIACGRTWKEVI
jgi:hypothetical protein